jgi:hypothetical protein
VVQIDEVGHGLSGIRQAPTFQKETFAFFFMLLLHLSCPLFLPYWLTHDHPPVPFFFTRARLMPAKRDKPFSALLSNPPRVLGRSMFQKPKTGLLCD